MHHRALLALAIVLAALLALPTLAAAAEKSRAETGTYDLDFTLPTAGKSGCEVCHSDKNLVRIVDGEAQSMYVDVEELQDSAHAKVACTQCHTDFTFKSPHENAASDEWKRIARSSCKNSGCHPQPYADVNLGMHSTAVRQEGTKEVSAEEIAARPLCGDCHGGHDIQVLTDNPKAQAELHSQGLEMCGECHEEQTANYGDYYHGAAYQRGALDAPACWECHNAHDVYPTSDQRSPTNPQNISDTCGGSAANGARCHLDPAENQEFLSYASTIHGRQQVQEGVVAWAIFDQVRTSIQGVFDRVWSLF